MLRPRLILLGTLAAFVHGAAIDKSMHFTLHSPCRGSGYECGTYILAEGEITASTPLEFERLARKADFRGTVYFNSPGGSLIAGIELGRLIRKLGLNTYVGGPYQQVNDLIPDESIVLVDQGVCFSACVYAFMGGRIRELDDGGLLGVHQFRTRGGDSGEGSAQLTVAALAEFVKEMGVDRTLLDLASATDPTHIEVIPLRAARALNLDNNDPTRSEWRLKAKSNGDLTLSTVQRQDRNDAVTMLSFTRQGNHVVGVMTYHIQQDFRSKSELNSIFAGMSEFYVNVDAERIAHGTASWRAVDSSTFTTIFLVPQPILEKISQVHRFTIDFDIPHANWDVSPGTEFGTVGLPNGLKALLRI